MCFAQHGHKTEKVYMRHLSWNYKTKKINSVPILMNLNVRSHDLITDQIWGQEG